MKKLVVVFFTFFAFYASAQTNTPPKDDGQFVIPLPMQCLSDTESVFKWLKENEYVPTFVGPSESAAGGSLFVSVFMQKGTRDYVVLLISDTAGVCKVVSGELGEVYNVDKLML
jgi:hypothetical protein